MLGYYGLSSVSVVSVPGKLTDHYNPLNKTVNLSPEVFQGRSVASAAIAAHECGHAVQHSTSYFWLGMRSKMVPVVNASSRIYQAFRLENAKPNNLRLLSNKDTLRALSTLFTRHIATSKEHNDIHFVVSSETRFVA